MALWTLPARADRYVFRNYSIREGLPDLGVTDILQDRMGYIWVATESGGVARFDGRQFEVFGPQQGLPASNVRCLAKTRGGTLWAGCKGGAAWFDGRRFEQGAGLAALDGKDVRDILEDSKGRLWFATFEGLFCLEEGRLRAYEGYYGEPRWSLKGWEDKVCSTLVQTLAEGRGGDIWIGTAAGLSRFSEGRFWNVYFDAKEGGLRNSYISCLMEDSRGVLWLGSDAGVERFRDNRFELFNLPGGQKTYVLDFMEDGAGQVWIATMGQGILRFDGRNFRSYSEPDGLEARDFWCLDSDGFGNLWMGSMASGLWMFQGESFSFEDAGGGIPKASVRAVTRDSSGALCVGTWGLGLYRYGSRGLERFTTRDGLPSDFIHALCPARSGGVWIATNLGMAKLQGSAVTPLPSEPFGVFHAQIIRDVWEDQDGVLWAVSLERGLLRWDGRRLQAFPEVYPKTFVYSRTLFRDSRGRLWLGTLGGLYELAGGQLRFHRITEIPPSDFVIQIAEDRMARLWLLTPHKLLVSESAAEGPPGPCRAIPLGSGEHQGTLASLAFDGAGDAWVGGTGRLFRIGSVAPGGSPAVRDYGVMEGFPPEACQERACFTDPSGDLFMGTSHGLLRLRPRELDLPDRTPLVYLTGVRLFFRDKDWSAREGGLPYAPIPPEGTVLAPEQDHITFDYTGLVFPGSRQLHFQHRLEGVDEDWTPPSLSTSATYPDLRPGAYTFRVRTGLPGGEWKEAVPLSFSIRRPFWMTPWFYLICLATLILAVLAVVHVRTRMLVQRRSELETLVARRTSELAEARDGLERKVEKRTEDLVSAREALESQLQKTRAAQSALSESEARFRSLYENAIVGIFQTDAQGRILLANPALLSILGARDLGDLSEVRLCCEKCVSGAAPGSCPHTLRRTETPGVFEVAWTRTDGEPVMAKVHAKVLPGPDGKARFVEGTVEDITAVRKAQYRLDFLEKAVQAMDLGLAITDSAHRILYANPSEARMHGTSVEALIGSDARDMAPESLRHQREWQGGEGRWVYRREGLNRRSDGRLFPVHLTSVPLVGKSGMPLGMITLSEDLTEAKRKEIQLQEALRDAVVGKLAAMVAHQVNTPLAAMKTRLELLRDDTAESEEAQRGIEILMKQVDKVAQTIRALLGFVRQRSVAESPVPLQDVVASVVRLFESAFQSKGITVTAALPDQGVMVQGSPSDLQEVFLNLFENHREVLGRDSHVWVSARSGEGVVEVLVEDDGPGLGPDPEKVFEPFYTTKATGTGLGLPICRNICAACGGSIRAENRPAADGGGAQFVITLPLAGDPQQKGSGP